MSGAEGWTRRAAIGGSAALLASAATGAAPPGAVRTRVGNFIGTRDGGVRAFRGIRYGTAPRFRAPVAFAAPGQTIAADAFGPVCPQRGPYGP